MWNSIFNLFFPKICTYCQIIVQEKNSSLCLKCWAKLPRIEQEKQYLKEKNSFFSKENFPDSFFTPFLLFKKKGITQQLIHEIKYKGNRQLAFDLGKKLANEMLQNKEMPSFDYLIPVPLHVKKIAKRGYNQAEELAKGIADVVEKPILTDILIRNLNNQTQTQKNRLQRWESSNTLFEAKNSTRLNGKKIALVDDVFTTGATLAACLETLYKNNPDVEIGIITLALSHE